MHEPENCKRLANSNDSKTSLRDADITTVRVDRRSFLSRAVAAGSVTVGVALTTGCPGGTDGTDSDSESE